MMKILPQWFAPLHEVERDLWNQGYIVIYGGGTSFVVPVVSNKRPDRQPRKRLSLWAAAPAASLGKPSCGDVRVQRVA